MMTTNKLSALILSVALATTASAKAQPDATSTQPDWFQTSPNSYAGQSFLVIPMMN